MAVFTEDELKKQIKDGDFQRVYLIYGDEGYLKQYYADLLCTKTVEKDFADFNLNKLDGADSGLNVIYDCISAFPMMGGYTCTLVKDLPLNNFIGDRGKVDSEFQTVLDDIPETSVLVFYMDTVEVDEKNSKWAKVIKLIDERGVCAKIDKRSRTALEKLLVSSAAKKGCELSRETAGYLINLAGEDLATLRNELDKVCGYVGSGEIKRSHIDETVIVSVEAKIFQLSRMIAQGNADSAYENLQNLFKLREEPVAILAVLSKAYVDMYRVKAAKEKGIYYSKLGEYFPSSYKGREFVLKNADSDCSHYSLTQLKNALDALTDADRRLKSTGEDGKLVLEELILKLLRI